MTLAACVQPDVVECGQGLVCPSDTECKAVATFAQNFCATREQLDACTGKPQFDPCTLKNVETARCYDGVCLEASCGNLRTDYGEQCDDGNSVTGDGCAADCLSNETCGNSEFDVSSNETCDDGNLIDHDGCSSTCRPETLHWVQRSLRPTRRQSGVAAYDPIRDRVVMFSGVNDTMGVLGDLWEWDGGTWTPFTGPVPPGRNASAMAFDGSGVVLYGGGNGMSDTWTFDGVTWSSHAVAGPGPRYGHAIAYDSHRRRAVMFGGNGMAGASMYATGTWEWDGNGWTKRTTTNEPPLRIDATMTYDPVRGYVVLAGGSNGSGLLADTWVYDGTDWTEKIGAGWPARRSASAAFDRVSGNVIAYGGANSGDSVDETLAWNGSTWSVLSITGPTKRAGGMMASAGDRVVYFGGLIPGLATPYDETWILQTRNSVSSWAQPVTPGLIVPQDVAYASDIARGRLVVFHAATGSTWELGPSGWEKRATTGPSVRIGTALAYDPTARKVLLFGGRLADDTVLADTWSWNGTAWTQIPTTSQPSGRFGVSMMFDGQHVTLIGGNGGPMGNPMGPRHDAWWWDGANWNMAAEPPADVGGLAGFDPIRNVAVTFNIAAKKTYTYDGTTWTVASMTVPSHDSRLAWNPASGTLVLAGGTVANDPWEWDGTSWSRLAPDNTIPSRQSPLVATAIDGAGIFIYGGESAATLGDEWELRWDGPALGERCDATDADKDEKVGCDDLDCWRVCTPECPPGMPETCSEMTRTCGDGMCDAVHETCVTCAVDCPCTPVCGDLVCTSGETCTGDCP